MHNMVLVQNTIDMEWENEYMHDNDDNNMHKLQVHTVTCVSIVISNGPFLHPNQGKNRYESTKKLK